jgi:hypothetical protein
MILSVQLLVVIRSNKGKNGTGIKAQVKGNVFAVYAMKA